MNSSSAIDDARLHAPPFGVALLRSLVPVTVALVLALAMQRFGEGMLGDTWLRIATVIAINIVLAVSLTIVNGFTGQFSLGHAGFMSVGALTAAVVTYYGSYRVFGDALYHGGWLSWTRSIADYSEYIHTSESPPRLLLGFFGWGDLWFLCAMLVAGVVAAIFGWIVGLPSLRLRGDYLAIVTLGFGEIVRVLVESTQTVPYDADEIAKTPFYKLATKLGGASGFNNIPSYTSSFWVWLLAGITIVSAWRIKTSTMGRAFLAIRENEVAAESMGVPVTRYKVRAFVIAAFFAGIAGALACHQPPGTIDVSKMAFERSFEIVIMVVLGGLGSVSGAVTAAAIVTVAPELLRHPPHAWPAAIAVAIVIVIVKRKHCVKPLLILAGVVVVIELARWYAVSREIDLSRFRMVIYALTLIVIMIVRPQGLFGLNEAWELLPWRRAKRAN